MKIYMQNGIFYRVVAESPDGSVTLTSGRKGEDAFKLDASSGAMFQILDEGQVDTIRRLLCSQINPETAIKNKWLFPVETTKVQQVGIDCSLAKAVTIQPCSFINIDFAERIALPNYVKARITIRSSYSRKGVFQSSGIYDPGYGSDPSFAGAGAPVGCSLYNLSSEPVTIPADRVAQLEFEYADAASSYNGHYNKTSDIKSQL